jgi:hypothetical protein
MVDVNGAGNGAQGKVYQLSESRLLAVAARVSSVFGATLASIAVWIFTLVWDDVKQSRADIQALYTRQTVAERDIADHSVRLNRVEARVFFERTFQQ